MATYEFPPKTPVTEDSSAVQTPLSAGARLVKLLQWSLYSVVALLVAGYFAVQTNPELTNYLAAVPGLGSPSSSSCRMSACAQAGPESCCPSHASECTSMCLDERQARELALPPAPPMPETLPVEDATL